MHVFAIFVMACYCFTSGFGLECFQCQSKSMNSSDECNNGNGGKMTCTKMNMAGKWFDTVGNLIILVEAKKQAEYLKEMYKAIEENRNLEDLEEHLKLAFGYTDEFIDSIKKIVSDEMTVDQAINKHVDSQIAILLDKNNVGSVAEAEINKIFEPENLVCLTIILKRHQEGEYPEKQFIERKCGVKKIEVTSSCDYAREYFANPKHKQMPMTTSSPTEPEQDPLLYTEMLDCRMCSNNLCNTYNGNGNTNITYNAAIGITSTSLIHPSVILIIVSIICK